MVICFQCLPETKAQLDGFLAEGTYKDYSEAINVAITNQALLHKDVREEGPTVLNQREVAGPSSPPAKPKSGHLIAVDYSTKKIIAPTIPQIFQMTANPSDHEAAPMSDDDRSENLSVPVDEWIFGQYNKLFPIKASCRALSNIFSSKQPLSNLKYMSEQIAVHAVELGRYLLHQDLHHSIARDDRLSTAFPSPEPTSDKSRDRYAKQFVIDVAKSGEISGLLVDYKFLNFTRDKSPRIMLTEPGWYFALLSNPILDAPEEDSIERFSPKELDFLIEHIFAYVPVERMAYRTLLQAVANGNNTPEKLDSVLRDHVRDTNAYSSSFLAAQRSGAISRMADLGFLTRLRDGVRVTYNVTQAGHDFLKRVA